MPNANEDFQVNLSTIPDLFSMEDVEADTGLLSPSMLMMAEEDEHNPVLLLREGSEASDRTLSSLNTRSERTGNSAMGTFGALGSPSSSHELEASCSSAVKAVASLPIFRDEVVVVKPDLSVVNQDVSDKENISKLQGMMTKPTITRPSKRDTITRNGQPHERKRPGRKRLELPSEEEVHSMTDPIIKKRLQNRKASRECRARKADYLGEIEEKVRQLESQNAELSWKYSQEVKERSKVNQENARLRLKLDEFERHFQSMNISHVKGIAVC